MLGYWGGVLTEDNIEANFYCYLLGLLNYILTLLLECSFWGLSDCMQDSTFAFPAVVIAWLKS